MTLVITGASLVNASIIENKLVQAFKTWAEEDLDDGYFESQFKDAKWNYGGTTDRKNGNVAGPVRDIYDLGNLYESGKQSFDVTIGSSTVDASWNWDAKNDSGNAYAIYVHEGLGTNRSPRRWTEDLYVPTKFAASVVSGQLKARIRSALNK